MMSFDGLCSEMLDVLQSSDPHVLLRSDLLDWTAGSTPRVGCQEATKYHKGPGRKTHTFGASPCLLRASARVETHTVPFSEIFVSGQQSHRQAILKLLTTQSELFAGCPALIKAM